MLPHTWTPHRREDGETVGWIAVDGDDVVAFDLLGRRVTAPGVDWLEAEQELEARGLGYLAGRFTLTLHEDRLLPVRIGEVTTDRVTVVADEFGGASVVGADPETHVLPFPVPPGVLRDYVRPPVDLGTYRDDHGRPIEYGSVYWGEVEPPTEVYSTCAHPERFQPVVEVGLALLDHLTRTYDVDRATDEVDGRTRVVLTPRSGAGTPLTIELPLPGLPGVEVTAGSRYRNAWPDCGCDACDDDVLDLLDDLETTVFAIAEGGMREWRSGPDGDVPWCVHVEFDAGGNPGFGGGWSAGEPEPVDVPTTPHRWEAWPLRARRDT